MDAVLLPGGVNRHDVGVVQLRGRFRLAAEALHRLGGQPQAAREDFQGHRAVERHLPGLVDDAHAAPAELPADLEIAQPLLLR